MAEQTDCLSVEQSGQAHINSPIPSIMRGLNTLRAEHGCSATSTIRASAHPCGAFLSYRRRSFLYDKNAPSAYTDGALCRYISYSYRLLTLYPAPFPDSQSQYEALSGGRSACRWTLRYATEHRSCLSWQSFHLPQLHTHPTSPGCANPHP